MCYNGLMYSLWAACKRVRPPLEQHKMSGCIISLVRVKNQRNMVSSATIVGRKDTCLIDVPSLNAIRISLLSILKKVVGPRGVACSSESHSSEKSTIDGM